jgi:hypothetical protein
MANIENSTGNSPVQWSIYKKIAFRIAFVFFILVSIPLSVGWYKNLAGIDWTRPHYRDIYDIARYGTNVPSIFPGSGRQSNGEGDGEGAGQQQEGNRRGRQNRRDSLANAGGVDSARVEGQHTRRKGGDKFAASGDKSRRHRNRDIDTTGGRNQRPDSLKSAGFGAARDNSDNGNAQAARSRSWLADYTSWGNALVIAVIIGLIWTLIDRKRPSYNVLYYWLTVVVRYRAAIGIIGFGFTKLFPTQMPYPSLGLLNTDFGDFTAQKIYWLSVGIVPWYQVFGGIVEVAAGLLLFFRKTATFGAILLIGALGDITFVNYAYDGGVHVYAFYFVLLGSFVVAADVPRLYNLLVLERYTVPHFYYPDYTQPVYKYTRIGLKGLTFLIFFVVLTYTEVINFKYDPYKQPSTAGVKTLRGNYNVTEFKINNQVIPYSPLDTVRWKEATFEKWTTLTFRVNKKVVIDPSNGGGSPMRDIQRTFEISGTAGGQRAFHYYADTVDQILYLQDKNAVASRGGRGGGQGAAGFGTPREPERKENWISPAAWKHIGDENKMIDPRAWSARRDREFAQPERSSNRNKMILKYSTTDGSRVILTGINENKDSIYVVLDKVNRKYVLPQSTLSAGKY